MSLDIGIALVVGAFCGAIATIFLIGLAFAVNEHKRNKKEVEDAEYERMDR